MVSIYTNLLKRGEGERGDKIKAPYREKIRNDARSTRTFLVSREPKNERNDTLDLRHVVRPAFTVFTHVSNYEQCLPRYCNLQSRV